MSRVMREYIIAYDISDTKRLARVARYLTKESMRIQYSIYYLPSTPKERLESIAAELSELINKEEDDLRIYTIKKRGYRAGVAVDLAHPFILT